ncbi:gamma-butyrobetaine hydroxylase-like domain-containing protein [Thalassotalea aquiviva]|uniref:gamma-butyrobetaine hydroxylase-like domain-containing protein n=1 Tax=Thalassotalea aquiviva TaxID=3242415 RepID=UPI00352A0458
MSINQFTIDRKQAQLLLECSDGLRQTLCFEFLRVYSPLEQTQVQGRKKPPVSHKKMVQLLALEPVGKHGFRLHFDDGHQAIYSAALLLDFAHNKATLWQDYLTAVQQSGHSREAMIDIKQV